MPPRPSSTPAVSPGGGAGGAPAPGTRPMRPRSNPPAQSPPEPDGIGSPAAELLLPVLRQLVATVEELRDRLDSRTKDYYTVEEVAQSVYRSEHTIRRWIAEGKLEATRVAATGPRGRLLIARDQLRRLVTSGLAGEVPDIVAG